MAAPDPALADAIRAVRHGDAPELESLLVERTGQRGSAVAPLPPVRQSGPAGQLGDSAEAWADRLIRRIFDLVGAARWQEANRLAAAALGVFEADDVDADQLPRLVAAAAVTALDVGDLSRAFDLAVDALVKLWEGGLSPRSAASVANTLGSCFERLGAWELAIDQYEAALGEMDPAVPLEAARVLLTTENLVISLHESIASGRAVLPVVRIARMARLEAIKRSLGLQESSHTARFTVRLADAAVALLDERPADAADAALAIEADGDLLLYREQLAWRLLGARTLLASRRCDEADEWASEAVRLAEAGDGFRLPDALQLRAEVRWALGLRDDAFADAMAAIGAMSESRSDRIAGLARGLGDRARLELARRELSDVSASLARSAGRDPLTGLANRRALGEAARRIAASHADAAVLVVDIDRFKSVNDTNGHAVGDAVLQRCAEMLREAVPAPGIVARLGGDEFVAVVTEGVSARHLGALVCDAVRGFDWSAESAGLAVTVSVGTATGAAADLDELIARADAALYQAKRDGRDRVVNAGRATADQTPVSPVSPVSSGSGPVAARGA